ncbi:MAG: DUF5606 domain-containing protein [Bacteroidia bacterium]|nr:DUF5606 domain-containing protein [Bacteroidia bacterium]
MELKDVVSIGGKPGLHKIVGQRTNGLIVESIDDRKKRTPTSLTQKVSILDDISIYTTDEDVRLFDVFKSLDTKVNDGLGIPVKKDGGDAIRDFFGEILPNFDRDQVYTSDILKICSWYAILKDHIDFQKEPEASDDSDEKKETTKAKTKKPSAKKAPVKKVSAKSAPAKAPKVTQRKMS